MLQNRPTGLAEMPMPAIAPVAAAPQYQRRRLPWWVVVPAFAVALFAIERYAPEQYKPSTITGGFVGNEEAIRLRTQLEAMQATVARQNEENARMQQEVELFRARTERVTEAYKVLFTRANTMAQAVAQVQQQYMMMRQQLVKEIQGVNVGMAQGGDLASIIGMLFDNQHMKEAGKQLAEAGRRNALNEFDESMRQGLAKSAAIFSNWQSGVPDITQIDQMVTADRTTPLTPAPRTPAPLPPPPYQTTRTVPPAAPAPAYQTGVPELRAAAATVLPPASAAARPQGASTAVVTAPDNELNLRAEPNAKAQILTVLYNNTSVEVVESYPNGWKKISVALPTTAAPLVGFVNGKYLTQRQ